MCLADKLQWNKNINFRIKSKKPHTKSFLLIIKKKISIILISMLDDPMNTVTGIQFKKYYEMKIEIHIYIFF